MFCKKEIKPGTAIYITKVKLTDNDTTTWRNIERNVTPKTAVNKLRIQHYSSVSPRYIIHESCYHKILENVILKHK
jgi:hypothetical protein